MLWHAASHCYASSLAADLNFCPQMVKSILWLEVFVNFSKKSFKTSTR